MAVGDVNLAWHVGDRIESEGPEIVLYRVAGFFAPADLVVLNLECSLSDAGEPWPGKEEHFAAPERAVEALESAGVDVVTLGNNHVMDFSQEGMTETMAILDSAGIQHAGAGTSSVDARAPVIFEQNGLRLALLSYVVPFSAKQGFNTREWAAREDSPGVAVAHHDEVRADVRAARADADVVVVFLHNGGEYRRHPKRSQVAMADTAIAAGAALVVGHGPHNLQGYVRRGKTLIAYSLGNFVFDEYTGPQNDSAILDVTLSAQGVENVDWIPMVIEEGLPRPATAGERARIMSQLSRVPHNDD
jgi:poly-gamma-glutamate synthesis protein (capsule biosynthesis protein)